MKVNTSFEKMENIITKSYRESLENPELRFSVWVDMDGDVLTMDAPDLNSGYMNAVCIWKSDIPAHWDEYYSTIEELISAIHMNIPGDIEKDLNMDNCEWYEYLQKNYPEAVEETRMQLIDEFVIEFDSFSEVSEIAHKFDIDWNEN